MNRMILVGLLALAACATPPRVAQVTPRSIVTTHNPNQTSTAEIGRIAEGQCKAHGLHAKINSYKNTGTEYFPQIETVWDCVE